MHLGGTVAFTTSQLPGSSIEPISRIVLGKHWMLLGIKVHPVPGQLGKKWEYPHKHDTSTSRDTYTHIPSHLGLIKICRSTYM